MNEKIKRLDLTSADGVQLNLNALYQIAPSCFTEARDPKTGELKRVVNFDALRQLLGDDAVDESRETYEFRWVGKDAAKAEERAEKKAAKKANSKKEEAPMVQNVAASTTLGDIDALAALKAKIESGYYPEKLWEK